MNFTIIIHTSFNCIYHEVINLMYGMLVAKNRYDHIGEITLNVQMVLYGLWIVQIKEDYKIVQLNFILCC